MYPPQQDRPPCHLLRVLIVAALAVICSAHAQIPSPIPKTVTSSVPKSPFQSPTPLPSSPSPSPPLKTTSKPTLKPTMKPNLSKPTPTPTPKPTPKSTPKPTPSPTPTPTTSVKLPVSFIPSSTPTHIPISVPSSTPAATTAWPAPNSSASNSAQNAYPTPAPISSPQTPPPARTTVPQINTSSSNATGQCAARRRKAWGAMSIDEQTIYIEALALGMERGFHMLFAELHSEKSSSIEAYRTCGFLYWNRRFLLAYENMLRSLGARYACVTIPYWDYFADYAKFIGNKCDSFQSCSTILAGIGGSKGVPKSVTINGRTFTDNCVTQFPFSSFCESSSIIDKSLCAGCVPRAELTSKPFPSGLGYAGLGVMLGKAKGLRDFNNNILFGVHNSIHSALGSTMASIVAPADPLFFSHHATIDMLHQMYLECQVGDSYLSDTSLGVQRFVFQKCSIAGETCPDTSSPVTQLWATAAAPADTIPAEVHSSLKQFFSNLPTKYSNWASTSALGVNSYDYERDDLLTNLQKYGFVCPSQAFTVQSILTSTRSEKSAEATPNEKRALQFIDFGRQPIVATPKSPPPPNPPAMADGFGTISGPLPSLPVDPDRDFIQALSIDFLDSALLAARAIDGTLETAFLQVELMECAFYDRFFRVDDLTKEFRDSFGLGDDTHTRCTTLKTQLANGEAAILVDDWISYFQQLVRG